MTVMSMMITMRVVFDSHHNDDDYEGDDDKEHKMTDAWLQDAIQSITWI